VRDALERVEAVDPAGLSADDAIDRDVFLRALRSMRFSAEELRDETWSPLSYVYLFGEGLFALLAREFAPRGDRLRSAAQRLRALPAALDRARATLDTPHARPVSRFHTEKAIERLPGVADLAQNAVEEAERHGDQALLAEVREAGAAAGVALGAFGEWLRSDLLPRATGDFRLGPELYARKLGHNLQVDISVDALRARAAAGYEQVRAQMLDVAREIWPTWMGDQPMPADLNTLVRSVLDAIAAEHPAPKEMLDWCAAEYARIEHFVRQVDLMGLPDEPMKIVWTPQFMRSFGGAMLIAPGPLDRGLDSFFAITPMPADWDEARRESYLREENNRQMRLLTIHEAVPGHYLQLAYSNRCPSLVRAIFQSGTFAEGWAVYVTQVMMDVGYGADDRALLLVHLKFFLRSITNTLMDIEIHSGSMDEAAAMRLMVEGGFQEEGEATSKWERARLSSTQLCEYYLGSVLMTDLEQEARRRAAAEGREFVWRPFLESVLAHGTPPMPVIRQILFG